MKIPLEDRLIHAIEMTDTLHDMACSAQAKVDNAWDTLKVNVNSPHAWQGACRLLREAGEDYISFGNKWRQIADYLEPTMDEMIKAGKEDIRDD